METKPKNQMINIENPYYPGKLIILMNEFFNNQKTIDNYNQDISFWETYVNNYFNRKCKYCIIMNQEGKQWIFNSGYETLPFVLKEKYSEKISLISVNLDEPYEYILNPDKDNEFSSQYMLVIKKFRKIEQYQKSFVVTDGILTITFDKNFKINNYEFQSLSHKEYPNEDENNDLLPLNDFGITPKFSRTLVISEALLEMIDSINNVVDKFK